MKLDTITVWASKGLAHSERVLASGAGDLAAGEPTLAGPVEIRWSRPASMLPPAATEVTINVLTPVDDPRVDVNIDTRLTIEWEHSGLTVTVFDGMVDAMTWNPPEGRRVNGHRLQTVTVNAICPIGRYSRTKVGDEPWVTSNSIRRRLLLSRLLPVFETNNLPVSDIEQTPNTDDRYTRAVFLDIDSRSPVEVMQELLNAHRQVLVAGTSDEQPTIEAMRTPTRSRGRIVPEGGSLVFEPVSFMGDTVDVPAALTDDTTRTKSFDSSISSVTVTYQLGQQGRYPINSREVSRTWGDLSAPGTSLKIHQGIVSLQYNSGGDDDFKTMQPLDPPHADFYAGMVQPFDRDTTRLGPVRVPLSRLPDTAAPMLAALTDLSTRWTTNVRFEGAMTDVPPLHYPIGGALILSGDPDDCELMLDLEPAELLTEPAVLWRSFGIEAGYPTYDVAAFTYGEAALASEVTQ